MMINTQGEHKISHNTKEEKEEGCELCCGKGGKLGGLVVRCSDGHE